MELFLHLLETYGIAILIGLVLFTIVIYDVFIQKKHAIKHNFPIVGRLRYLLEMIGPELRQYWVANDKEEMPFNRAERRWIYATSKNQNSTFGFGTSELLYETGYPILKHSGFPLHETKASYVKDDKTGIPCLKVIGEYNNRKRPYRPTSVINISAMSFGSLGYRAISALNKGAKMASCFHNTGEGSVSDYHDNGADLVWQIGTGYFGCRNKNGSFSLPKAVAKTKKYPTIRAIEIKLSQGAKPGKGGILPAAKVTQEIAEIRGIPVGKACMSPNAHNAFSTASELIDFVEQLADATGLPVGIKCAVGQMDFWEELSKEMKNRKQGPDFIVIDGGEGGTGAAPLTFADHVSLPFKVGFSRVYSMFQKLNIEQNIVWIGSAKLGFPDRAIIAFAMGCDLVNIAREAMLSIGCIQAQRCHNDDCPAGIATQNKWLQAGINVEEKADRAQNFIQGFRKELLALSLAAGYNHPSQFSPKDIEFSAGVNVFRTLGDILGYEKKSVPFTNMQDYQATP